MEEKNRILSEDIDEFAGCFPFSDEIRNKTFLITGATGLLGSILVRCLLRLNDSMGLNVRIIATARNEEKARRMFGVSPIDWLFQDAASPIDLGGRKADYVIHLANPTSSRFFVEKPVETLRTTVSGIVAVLEYAREAKPESVVYISSLEVYGTNHNDDAIAEDFQGYVNPVDVRSSYNIGKRTAECLCHAYAKEYGVAVKIARLTQTFGAGVEYGDSRVFAQFARNIIERKDIELHTKGLTSRMYCYTTDAISAIFFLLLKGTDGEAYNVANPSTYISICDMAGLLASKSGNGSKVIFRSKDGMGYAPETRLRLDTSKLEALGWRPRYGLEEMFRRLTDYMRSEKGK